MSAKLHTLWHHQAGLCFYCGLATYLPGSGETKDQARARLGVIGKPFRRRKATLEHLHRKVDGGSNRIENLVMACLGCNSDRQDTPVEIHKAAILARMAAQ